jgi:tubulin polyglutamylase TTLL4
MLDDNFRAWLIEANTCPSLASDSALDKRIKNAMLADVMNLVGLRSEFLS